MITQTYSKSIVIMIIKIIKYLLYTRFYVRGFYIFALILFKIYVGFHNYSMKIQVRRLHESNYRKMWSSS